VCPPSWIFKKKSYLLTWLSSSSKCAVVYQILSKSGWFFVEICWFNDLQYGSLPPCWIFWNLVFMSRDLYRHAIRLHYARFRSYNSVYSCNISGLEKQTSALLEFYFRFRFRPYHCIVQVILHQAVEFHSNRTIRPSSAELWCYIDFQDGGRWSRRNFAGYFRFRICWRPTPCLQMIRVYQQTKLPSYSSVHVWVITTSGLEKRLSAVLEFYYQYRLLMSIINLYSASPRKPLMRWIR